MKIDVKGMKERGEGPWDPRKALKHSCGEGGVRIRAVVPPIGSGSQYYYWMIWYCHACDKIYWRGQKSDESVDKEEFRALANLGHAIIHENGQIEVVATSMLKGLSKGECNICGNDTAWVEMNYQARICSAECLHIMDMNFYAALTERG